MNNVFKIFNQLQSTSKKNEKIAILKENKNNSLFTNTLKWLLNPFVITGIGDKKLNKSVHYDTSPIQTWEDMMLYLENNNTGDDTDIAIVQGFINLQSEEHREYYKQLITKSLKLGIDAKTVNSVYGKGFIPVFDVQLGTPLDKVKLISSGFTDEQRNYYWNNPDEIVGKIITVKYKEETKNKDGSYSLQFPVFQTVRFDKAEPNI